MSTPETNNTNGKTRIILGLRGKLTLFTGVLLFITLFMAVFSAMQKQESALSEKLDETAPRNLHRFSETVQDYYKQELRQNMLREAEILGQLTTVKKKKKDNLFTLFYDTVVNKKEAKPIQFHNQVKFKLNKKQEKALKNLDKDKKNRRQDFKESLDLYSQTIDATKYKLQFISIENNAGKKDFVHRAYVRYHSDNWVPTGLNNNYAEPFPLEAKINSNIRTGSENTDFLSVGRSENDRVLVKPVFIDFGRQKLATLSKLILGTFSKKINWTLFPDENGREQFRFLQSQRNKKYFLDFLKKDNDQAAAMKELSLKMAEIEKNLWEENKSALKGRIDLYNEYRKDGDWRTLNKDFRKAKKERRKLYKTLRSELNKAFKQEILKPNKEKEKKLKAEIKKLKPQIKALKKKVKRQRKQRRRQRMAPKVPTKLDCASYRTRRGDLSQEIGGIKRHISKIQRKYFELLAGNWIFTNKKNRRIRGLQYTFDKRLYILYYQKAAEKNLSKGQLLAKFYRPKVYRKAVNRSYFNLMKNPVATLPLQRELEARTLTERARDTLSLLYVGAAQSAVTLDSQNRLLSANLNWWFDFGASLILRTIFFMFLLATFFVFNIKSIASTAGRIGEGDLSVRFKSNSNDELSVLAGDLNEMVKGLKERANLMGELQVAGEIQKRLLPETFPEEFKEHVEFGAFYKAMTGVGGDYYDFLSLAESDGSRKRFLLTIADVSNHGVGPAIIMTQLRSHLRGLAPRYKNLKDIVIALNQKIYEDTPGNIFITMFVGIYDITTKTMQYVMAGHNEALIRTAGGEIKLVDSAGMPLGVVDKAMYEPMIEVQKVKLETGDMFFQYTDGLTEAMDNNDELFEMERLQAGLKRYSKLPVNQVMQELALDVEKFSGKKIVHEGMSELNDDIAMIGFTVLK